LGRVRCRFFMGGVLPTKYCAGRCSGRQPGDRRLESGVGRLEIGDWRPEGWRSDGDIGRGQHDQSRVDAAKEHGRPARVESLRTMPADNGRANLAIRETATRAGTPCSLQMRSGPGFAALRRGLPRRCRRRRRGEAGGRVFLPATLGLACRRVDSRDEDGPG